MGRQFNLWEGDDGWKRFNKAIMSAVLSYAKAYAENKGDLLDILMQAHLLEVSHAFAFIVIMLCLFLL